VPIVFVIIALGAMRPTSWTLFFAGLFAAIILASLMTFIVLRLYPWGSEERPGEGGGGSETITRN
jgi:hypothetical protein